MNTLSAILNNLRQRTPVGSIEMYAGSSAPTGWLICDGAAVSRTDYPKLFSIIGTTYGAGDGSTTFNLPDMSGRMPVGVSSTYPISGTGSSGGSEDAIIPYHKHTASGAAVGDHAATACTGGAVTDKAAFNTNSSGTCSIGSSGGHDHVVKSRYVKTAGGSASWQMSILSGGTGSTVSSDVNVTIDANTGAHTHTVPNHTHSIPAHGHGFTQPKTPKFTHSVTQPTISYAGESGNITGANMPPYRTVNFIIYAGK